ncbi:type II secretion system minor pseudopilin GspK [Robbsia andropogonis]|uniref:type II secretion system minor pseudopilin GspK n=1 Tax=Robbsia andropogonis TaxID=28092 RepID=UPI0009DC965C|nr:type II secretion system minor pseudopilin GspK [Robbsia andropogonis]
MRAHPMMMRSTGRCAFCRPRAARARGAALITALLVTTLAAVLVSGLLWRQQVEIRRVENQREAAQARWVSRGVFDWARLILRTQADALPVTYLGGAWSVPIAPTRLSDFLGKIGIARAEQGASTWLSGGVVDAQSRFNLRNLVNSKPATGLQVNPQAQMQFQKLLSLLGLSSDLAPPAAQYVLTTLLSSVTKGQQAQTGDVASDALAAAQSDGDAVSRESGLTNTPGMSAGDVATQMTRPIQLHDVDDLVAVPGFTPAVIARLRPFVTILPVPTQINLNTAGPEVIAAALPALSLTAAQAMITARDQAFFINLGDAQTRLARFMTTGETLDGQFFDVTTHYFEIHARITHERAVVDRVALVYRDPRTHSTRIIRVQDARQ